ncbi:OmpA family protein [Parapedobacter lycopersici]|uniref:OmpA family protein n=1 Tax=Parapedobacter lycopersici TaxID=1864939 RepID=UPI00214D6239|nr:OmpA family protein [Parapedobacter lycopersici]
MNKIKSLKTGVLIAALPMIMLSISCGGGNQENNGHTDTTGTQQETSGTPSESENSSAATTFDINNIPVSDHDLGMFPFFSFPEGMTNQNKPVERKFDRLFFPIDGVMTPLEGRVWKTNVTMNRNAAEEWSQPYFEKSYDEAIKAVGGVKIFDGEITKEEYDRYHGQASYLGEDGSIGYAGQNIKVYAIHRADGGNVFIQLVGNNAGGYLNVLQSEPFKQTITMLKADQIQQELTEKGKAVLYINFDVDKATLKPEGKEAVQEIAKVLNNDGTLALSIEGHTDNTGNADHNKTLSENRANAVLEALTATGINRSRLKAVGYGAEKPLVANDSEEGKAKNRRVELVKI